MRMRSLLLSLFLVGCASSFNPHDHAVRVDSGLGWGSGVVVEGGVLTAAHVHDNVELDEDGNPILTKYTIHFEGEEYDVTGFSSYGERGTDIDWVLLHVDLPAEPAPTYCGPLETGQKVSAVGYPSAGFPVELRVHGRISNVDMDYEQMSFRNTVGLDMSGAPGISGAGVFNENGEVIGLYVGALFHSTRSHVTGLMTRLPEEVC